MTDTDIDKRAGELSTDEVKKIETRCHHSVRCHGKESFNNVKASIGEIDKHVSQSVNKLLIEDKCDLTSQEELPTDEAKELADSLKRAIRVRRVKVPRRMMSR